MLLGQRSQCCRCMQNKIKRGRAAHWVLNSQRSRCMMYLAIKKLTRGHEMSAGFMATTGYLMRMTAPPHYGVYTPLLCRCLEAPCAPLQGCNQTTPASVQAGFRGVRTDGCMDSSKNNTGTRLECSPTDCCCVKEAIEVMLLNLCHVMWCQNLLPRWLGSTFRYSENP